MYSNICNNQSKYFNLDGFHKQKLVVKQWKFQLSNSPVSDSERTVKEVAQIAVVGKLYQ